jgi:preprotein translocase subunit SecG
MANLNVLLLVFQVLLSITLIALVLLQHGKGADAGAAFGSGASATVFGARGSGNFLTKATSVVALLFFVTCLSLAYLASHREGPSSVVESVMDSQPVEQISPILTEPQPSDLPPAEPTTDSEPAANDGDMPPAE